MHVVKAINDFISTINPGYHIEMVDDMIWLCKDSGATLCIGQASTTNLIHIMRFTNIEFSCIAKIDINDPDSFCKINEVIHMALTT